MTREESLGKIFAEIAERDGYKVEWYSGKIVMQASASAFHSLIVTETVRQLHGDKWCVAASARTRTPCERNWSQR